MISRIFKNQKTRKKSPNAFKILGILIFDGDWRHTKYPFNFIRFGNFYHFELYCFHKSDNIRNKVHCAPLKLFQLMDDTIHPPPSKIMNFLECQYYL